MVGILVYSINNKTYIDIEHKHNGYYVTYLNR